MTGFPLLTWQHAERWARERPAEEAVVFGEVRIGWARLWQEIARTAAALHAAGVRPGDRIAMIAMARPEFIVSYLAAHRVGAVWVGFSPKYPLGEIARMFESCRPVIVFSLARYGDIDLAPLASALRARFNCVRRLVAIEAAMEGAQTWDAFAASGDGVPLPTASDDAEAPALMIYTSGSTGQPKAVVHRHCNILANVEREIAHWRMDTDTRVLLHFPINHAAASVAIGMAAVAAGSCMVMMDRFDAEATLRAVEAERITILGQAPAMFMLQLDSPLFNADTLRSVRHFIWSGAPAPVELVRRISEICAETGAGMLTGYGATETCGWITYTDPDADFETLSRSVGRIAAPFELVLLDAAGAPVPRGGTGEICVRGAFLMAGYLDNEAETRRAIDAGGFYHSGDLGREDDAGNLIITGRTNEMYKSGGEIVYPREIESVLEAEPDVLMAVVVNVPDAVFQQVGWAFVMPTEGCSPDPAALIASCRRSLANFKVPRRILIREALPLLAVGKLDRVRLREEARAMHAANL